MIAVISDVHANLPALEAVLADIDAAGVRRIWCLGDTVGYGPHVNETVRLVVERCEIVLAGNHDLAVSGEVPLGQFAGSARAGVEHARRTIDPECALALEALKPQRFLESVELYHASAHDPVWEYVKDTSAATRHLSLQRLPLSFVGHSHRQLAFRLDSGKRTATGGKVAPGTSVAIPTGDGGKVVINPGSVGQPRDGDPRAAWAHVEAGTVTMRRVVYDIASTIAAVRAAGLPDESGGRLEHGI